MGSEQFLDNLDQLTYVLAQEQFGFLTFRFGVVNLDAKARPWEEACGNTEAPLTTELPESGFQTERTLSPSDS